MQNDLPSKRPVVSVAMCTYNGERFLTKQVESILAQTYSNIELVIVDDCSKDSTPEIAKGFEERDSRVKFFQNKENLGFNKNFERAVTLCSGHYIAISDQDDIWLSYKLERLLQCIGENLMVYANSALMDDNDTLRGGFILDPSRDETSYRNYHSLLLQNFVSGHNLLFKREALEFILPFPKSGFYDWWMGFVMLYEKKLAYCNEVLTHYRIHDESVTTKIILKTPANRSEELRKECQTIVEAVDNFERYKGLRSQDALFLRSLKTAIQEISNSYYSPTMFRILLKNTRLLYPGYKKGPLKRLAFIYRKSRGIKFIRLPWKKEHR
jgi:glycosyltransferase involved in cell wall biosynthesis